MPRCCRRAFRWRIGRAIESKDLERRGGGHHRAGEGDCASDRCAADPLTHRAIEKLVETAKREGVELRQSYLRVAKRAAITVGRYTHAHQFKRARRELKFLRTRLGRIIRDVRRKIEGDAARQDRFGPLLDLALRVRHQEQRQRGPKVYSLHAPEVECIGRGKARAPYEFGCKVSIATPATAPKGGQFVLHAKALHGNNAILAAAGYNFSLLLRWFEELLRVLLLIICRSRSPRLLGSARLALGNILHGRLLTRVSGMTFLIT